MLAATPWGPGTPLLPLAMMGQTVSCSGGWVPSTGSGLTCPSVTLQAQGQVVPPKEKRAE